MSAESVVRAIGENVEWDWQIVDDTLRIGLLADGAAGRQCHRSDRASEIISSAEPTIEAFEASNQARSRRLAELLDTTWGMVALGTKTTGICGDFRNTVIGLAEFAPDSADMAASEMMPQLARYDCTGHGVHYDGIPGLGQASTALSGVQKDIEKAFARSDSTSIAPAVPAALATSPSQEDAIAPSKRESPSPSAATNDMPEESRKVKVDPVDQVNAETSGDVQFEQAMRDYASGYSGEASFDCRAARTQSEVAICSSEGARLSDYLLGKFYKAARSGSGDSASSELRRHQSSWIGSRNARCANNAECLKEENLRRMQRLFDERQSDSAVNARPTDDVIGVATDERAEFENRFVLHRVSKAPYVTPSDPMSVGGPNCAESFRPASNDEDRQLVDQGWLLGRSGVRKHGIYVAMAHGDLNGGQCRSLDIRLFIFRDSSLVGAVAVSDPSASRLTSDVEVHSNEVEFEFQSWEDGDPSCCPSVRGTHRIVMGPP